MTTTQKGYKMKTEIRIAHQLNLLETGRKGLEKAAAQGETALMGFYLKMITRASEEAFAAIEDSFKNQI